VRTAKNIKAEQVKQLKKQLEKERAYAVQEKKGFAQLREENERKKANRMDARL
jgi:hypothetical protein